MAYQYEQGEQTALFNWADLMETQYPDLHYMYHVPNEGKRNARTGYALVRAGLKKGVPDVVLPVPHGEYVGLYIEMKYGKNRPTQEQKDWLAFLKSVGHYTDVAYNWQEASEKILWYLKLPARVHINQN